MSERSIRTPVVWRHLDSGESFSSLYARVCRASAASLHELGSQLLGKTVHSITSHDFDTMQDTVLMRTFASRTHHQKPEIDFATLYFLVPRLSTLPWKNGPPPRWVLERRRKADQRRHGNWVHACPQCLQEDDEPYFRLLWRLGFLTECPRHGVQLIDRCPACSGNLDYLQASQGANRSHQWLPLSLCPRCGMDWRQAPCVTSDPMHCAWVRQLVAGLFEGWLETDNAPILVALYLDGLFILQRALRSKSGGNEMLQCLLTRLEIDEPPPDSSLPIERTSVEGRRALLRCVAYLLQDWPIRFVAECRRYNFRWNAISDQKGTTPFWLNRVGREWLDRSWYQPSQQEARSVTRILENHGLDAPKVTVREWLGAGVSKPTLGIRPLPQDAPWQGHLCDFEIPRAADLIRRSFLRRVTSILRAYCSRGLVRPPGRRPVQLALTL